MQQNLLDVAWLLARVLTQHWLQAVLSKSLAESIPKAPNMTLLGGSK